MPPGKGKGNKWRKIAKDHQATKDFFKVEKGERGECTSCQCHCNYSAFCPKYPACDCNQGQRHSHSHSVTEMTEMKMSGTLTGILKLVSVEASSSSAATSTSSKGKGSKKSKNNKKNQNNLSKDDEREARETFEKTFQINLNDSMDSSSTDEDCEVVYVWPPGEPGEIEQNNGSGNNIEDSDNMGLRKRSKLSAEEVENFDDNRANMFQPHKFEKMSFEKKLEEIIQMETDSENSSSDDDDEDEYVKESVAATDSENGGDEDEEEEEGDKEELIGNVNGNQGNLDLNANANYDRLNSSYTDSSENEAEAENENENEVVNIYSSNSDTETDSDTGSYVSSYDEEEDEEEEGYFGFFVDYIADIFEKFTDFAGRILRPFKYW